ncbi:MAG: GntR family transcriptional regulator [Chloroflexota bacterium]
MATELQTTERSDLAGRCYARIRDGILRRRFLPGERLAPDALARELGVSRTPIQDALKRLALEGLVEISPRRGTVVTRVTAKDVAELADLRLMIEVHAAGVAVVRATPADTDAMRRQVARLDDVLAHGEARPGFDEWLPANAHLHRFLVQLAGNDQLLKLYDRLNLDVRVLRVFSGWGLSPLRQFQEEHRQMLRAFEARDAAALQGVLRTHIAQATERVQATLQLVGGVL